MTFVKYQDCDNNATVTINTNDSQIAEDVKQT